MPRCPDLAIFVLTDKKTKMHARGVRNEHYSAVDTVWLVIFVGR
jgi:hypothetical protein